MCRITTKAPYGRHIGLTCVNHPEQRWSTKNIGSQSSEGVVFRSRSLFYETYTIPECDCPSTMLRLSPEYATLPDVAE